uniref:RUN and FYVE domain-containing protein 4 n=1 Tax=Dromaius novaehollandiae TaxID=8790 RepID=A0A8C4KP58_DRONO
MGAIQDQPPGAAPSPLHHPLSWHCGDASSPPAPSLVQGSAPILAASPTTSAGAWAGGSRCRQSPTGTCAHSLSLFSLFTPPWVPLSPAAEIPGHGSLGTAGRVWDWAWSLLPARAGPAQPCRPTETITELNRCYREQNLPVTDGSRELHSLCAQLEFLLQFDLKEKRNFFGQRKDYWDFLCQGLARRRHEHEGVRFVTSLDKLKTPVGRARAFLRYCLVHRQLAESLQLCLLDPQSLSEWYYARSPFLSPRRRAEILGSLYELDGITFHLALRRADLDTAWPMFSE